MKNMIKKIQINKIKIPCGLSSVWFKGLFNLWYVKGGIEVVSISAHLVPTNGVIPTDYGGLFLNIPALKRTYYYRMGISLILYVVSLLM